MLVESAIVRLGRDEFDGGHMLLLVAVIQGVALVDAGITVEHTFVDQGHSSVGQFVHELRLATSPMSGGEC